MMYQHFLPDGAVHINLGENPQVPRRFMEEYMAEGAPYIRALYYWPGKKSGGYDEDRIMDLILEAKKLILGNFMIPVPVNTNLSPVLRLIKVFEYLTVEPAKLKKLTPLRFVGGSRSHGLDTNFYGNHFPHEFLRLSEGHQLNPCLTEALAQDYGPPCSDC